jgi:hypothetical protein
VPSLPSALFSAKNKEISRFGVEAIAYSVPMIKTSRKSVIAIAAVLLLGAGALPATAATKAPAPKPSITGAPRPGGFGGGPNAAAFAKYTACLTKAGIKLGGFGGGRGFGAPGTRPTGVRPSGAPGTGAKRPNPLASLTPKQQKAFTACAALRPSFGGFGKGAPAGATPDGHGGGIAPKTGSSAAYIACLKSQGIPVTSAADIAGLDNQNPKIIAAEKACVGK